MILESRHLVGLFLMMVVIFGVVFVLGYEMGRNQVSGEVRASYTSAEEKSSNSPESPGTPSPSMLPGAQPAAANRAPSAPVKTPSTNAPPAKTVTTKSQPVAPPNNRAAPSPSSAVKGAPALSTTPMSSPLMPKGAVVLQVSALTVQGDALKMAQELQLKKFPAFVLAPGADHYYRVQVGPYPDAKSAEKAKAALEKEGFKPIVKR